MILAWLLLITGLVISAVAIYYSVVGLAAIFSAAVIPIVVMGSALEVAKLVCASWLKANWDRAPRLLKWYMSVAVMVLMLITSMGIFGFLSKAHNDQNLVSGDVQSKIAIYDEKIKTARENIESDRKQLKQMDEAVDQVMGRSTDEKGADKANAIRKSQLRDRSALAKDIEANQKLIASLNDEAAPIRAEVRKVEAEVGPLKYIAKFIYGEHGADENMLEKAVTWVIILIVTVFDPLAVIMLLGAQMTFAWHRGRDPLAEEEEPLLHETVPLYVADVGEPPTEEEQVEWGGIDHTRLSTDFDEPDEVYEEPVPVTADSTYYPNIPMGTHYLKPQDAEGDSPTGPVDDIVSPEPTVTAQEPEVEHVHHVDFSRNMSSPMPIEAWNKMIEEAEAQAAAEAEQKKYQILPELQEHINQTTVEERVAKGESYIDGEGNEILLDEESKKKTYMTKDSEGHQQVKTQS